MNRNSPRWGRPARPNLAPSSQLHALFGLVGAFGLTATLGEVGADRPVPGAAHGILSDAFPRGEGAQAVGGVLSGRQGTKERYPQGAEPLA